MADSAEVEVSASMTPLVKFAAPLGWLGLMSYFSFQVLTGSPNIRWGPGVPPVVGKIAILVLLLVGVMFTYRVSARLKKVWLIRDGIRASNYLHQESILWPRVQRVVVHGTFGHRRSPLVEIELWEPRPFGGRISLYPKSEGLLAELIGQAAAFKVNVEHPAA